MSVDLFENKDAWKSLDTKALMDIIPNYFEFSGDIENSAYLNWRFDSFVIPKISFMKWEKHILKQL